jgi:hypothetical protein
MEDSVKWFHTLLSRSTPPPLKPSTSHSEDTIIGARIRPLLEDEIEDGQVEGVLPRRREANVVDVHEMRVAVRGPPKLNVSKGETTIGLSR